MIDIGNRSTFELALGTPRWRITNKDPVELAEAERMLSEFATMEKRNG